MFSVTYIQLALHYPQFFEEWAVLQALDWADALAYNSETRQSREKWETHHAREPREKHLQNHFTTPLLTHLLIAESIRHTLRTYTNQRHFSTDQHMWLRLENHTTRADCTLSSISWGKKNRKLTSSFIISSSPVSFCFSFCVMIPLKTVFFKGLWTFNKCKELKTFSKIYTTVVTKHYNKMLLNFYLR